MADVETYEGAAGAVEYKADMDRAVIALQFLAGLPVDKMAHHLQHVHSVAPFLDPTAYLRGMDNLEEQQAVVRAVQAAIRELRKAPRLWELFQARAAVR